MKKQNKRIILIPFLALLILAALLLIRRSDTPTEQQNLDIVLTDDLIITSIEPYNGEYLEDGSDEPVENIMMITIENRGVQTLQYAEAKLVFGDTTAEFTFSTLKPGESMTVLEKNRLEYSGAKEVLSTSIDNVIYFQGELSFREDLFEIYGMDGAFNVKNVSGRDLNGNIAIYYKRKQDDIYQGGITYRVVIEGGIEKDGIKQVMTNHYTKDGCRVMFVDYTEME